MSIYVLNPNGTINASIKPSENKDLGTFGEINNFFLDDTQPIDIVNPDGTPIYNFNLKEKQGYLVAIETLGDFKSGKNYSANEHEVFDGLSNDKPLENESIENNTSGIIGQSNNLYPYAFGKNMDATNPQTEPLPFYRPYNTFFDLDHNYSGRNRDSEQDFELFANEAELLYGIPAVLNEPGKFIGDISNVFSSLLDMLLGAIIPITTMSLLQGLLQIAQSGPPDPFGLFGEGGLSKYLGNPDKYGKFIQYVKFDTSDVGTVGKILLNIVNSIIDGLVSILKTSERLMNFPSIPAGPGGIKAILKGVLNNITSFCIGYIFYLIPGFSLDERIKGSPEQIVASLLSTISSLVTSSKCRHHYNLLIRKIVKNNYYRKEILFKGKTITNVDGSTHSDQDKLFYQISDFFHRFVGERIGVGLRTLGIINARDYNKKNNLFSVRKMSELPILKEDENGTLPIPMPMGNSILGGEAPADKTALKTSNFNKSIYSLNSLITKSSNANTYLTYHNELIKQNEAIYRKKERRLSREHVQKLEAIIDADYMPFTIQDLRTNELFKFHAFLDNFNDSFSVSWEDAGMGFGRMDSIKTYKGTSRKIGVDFWLVSMSPEDFDYMWWMVNRLVALIYPQWSTPKPANIENQAKAGIFKDGMYAGIPFAQPFTQIPTGSPLVRLRLGDLFTSNYSKKGLARIFGFDLNNISFKDTIDTTLSEMSIPSLSEYSQTYEGINLEGYDIYSLRQYSNHLTGSNFIPFDTLDNEDFKPIGFDFNKKFTINYKEYEKKLDDIHKLFVKYSNFYYATGAVIDLDDINSPPSIPGDDVANDEMFSPSINYPYKKLIYVPMNIIEDEEEKILMLLYSVKINPNKDKNGEYKEISPGMVKTELPKVLKQAIQDKILQIQYNNSGDERIKAGIENNLNLKAFMEASGNREIDTSNPARAKLQANTAEIVNNPVVKSFESTMGEGLAGTIQGFSIGFEQDIPWELTAGSRAPMAVKIGLQLDVIHDILPGLDDQGIMRAPTYRVGNLNNEFFGKSVYDELPNNIGYSNGWEKVAETNANSTSTTSNTAPVTPTTATAATATAASGFGFKIPPMTKPLELK